MRIVEELRAAARRQARVWLLVDDLHTFGLDAVLLKLAQRPNVEFRLLNRRSNPALLGERSSTSRGIRTGGAEGKFGLKSSH
jgi:phosphatidylserine/phosphatidylglycerophosphate/cardiolipin synthase-like enzyme